MPTRAERQKRLLGDSIDERKGRRLSFLEADTQELKPDTNSVESILEQRRKRLDEQKNQPLTPRAELPTFQAIRDQMAQKASIRQGGPQTGVPQVKFGLPDPKITQSVFSFDTKKVEEARKDVVGTFLFGKQSITELGKTPDGFIDYAKEKGLVGTLYGTILKSSEQRTAERYEKLVQAGTDPERAFRIARAWGSDSPLPSDVNEGERRSMRNFTIWENAFIALEMADLLLVGKPVNTGLKAMTRGAQHQLFQQIAVTTSQAEARAIIVAKYPQLAGTEGVEELIQLARQVGEKDNWSKVLSDTKTGKELLEQTRATERVVPETASQQIFFENGIPIVRAGTEAQQPIRESLELRSEIRAAIAGEMETARLSNPNVFTNEVQAGAFPVKQEIGSKVRMFVPEDVTSLRTGDRLATSREVMEQSIGAGKARILEVMPDDLIRLADGTFTYAPKKAIGRDIAPTLRNIREGQRAKVAEIERNQVRVRAERARLQAEIEERQTAQRAEQAAAVAARRAEEVRKARTLAETGEANLKTRIEGLRTERATELSKVRETAKANRVQVQEGERTMRTLLSNLRKNDKATAKVSTTARKQIDRIRSLKRATPAEKKKLIERARKTRDRELARLKKEKETIRTKAKKATEALVKVRKETPDVARETARINTQYKQLIASDRSDTMSAVAKARDLVKTAEGQKQKVTTEKAKVLSEKTTTEYTTIMKDNFSTIKSSNDETKITIPDPISTQPLKGSGDVIANKVAQSIQDEANEVYKLAGLRNGIKDVIDGTAKIDAETLANISSTHRVAHNIDQLKSAVIRVGRDPEKAYFDFISSNAMDDSMAALYSALVRSDFILNDMNRLNNISRHFDKFGTRTAQELQARQLVGKLDYPGIISKMMRKSDELLKKRNINVATEVGKIEKALGDEFDRLITISKADAVEQLTKITCKV